MWRAPIYERVPGVWVLLGLLFIAAGLFLGFEFTLSFVYMLVGLFCCAFGSALFLFRLREHPRSSTDRRLSPNFVSAGTIQATPVLSHDDDVPVTEQSGSE